MTENVHNYLTELSDDERHRILASRRRRTLLAVVAAYGEATTSASLGEIASDVDRRERARNDAVGTPKEDLLVRLHHVHLPLLSEVGLVEYDPETKRVDLDGLDVDAPLTGGEASYSD